jgi:cysteine-rich repeat protein
LPVCGDGIVQASMEECDDGNTLDRDQCNSDCRINVCGDGVIGPGEQCDDGNGVGGDGCSNACTLNAG